MDDTGWLIFLSSAGSHTVLAVLASRT